MRHWIEIACIFWEICATSEALYSKEVKADGSHDVQDLPTEQLREGFEVYDREFGKKLKAWRDSELTAEELAKQVLRMAAKLRDCTQIPVWSAHVKAQIPELLAGIFALYSIVRSGDAFKSFEETARTSGNHPETETEFETMPGEDC